MDNAIIFFHLIYISLFTDSRHVPMEVLSIWTSADIVVKFNVNQLAGQVNPLLGRVLTTSLEVG